MKLASALARHFQADDTLPSLGFPLFPCRVIERPKLPIVDEGLARLLSGLALRRDLVRRGVIPVGVSRLEQLLHGGLMLLAPLRLIIRRMGAVDSRPFVPVDAQPTKSVQDRLQRRLDVSLLVRVVDPKYELPAVLSGIQPVVEGRANAADVQVTGRTGGEACANHKSSELGVGALGAVFDDGNVSAWPE